MKTLVSVIIPTTCESRRASGLHRAIQSVCLQRADVEVELILVVNGAAFDESLLADLSANSFISIRQLAEGNVSAARYDGLLRATGNFVCFLDDDDEFLPGALRRRVSLFFEGVDVVVTNGYRHNTEDVPNVPDPVADSANRDPVGSFLTMNWFASPASMFRRPSQQEFGLFDVRIRHFEWSFLFFHLLAADKRIRFDNCFTYRIYEDNPFSASKSIEYAVDYPKFLLTLSNMRLRPEHRSVIKDKYRAALNNVSQLQLGRGQRGAAWLSHIRCLASGGWKYISYTRHLFRG